MPDDTVMKTLLFDFYGELLTDRQREYFDLHYNEDLSLSEIAENEGISRQGVWDIIRRAEGVLRDTEEKTGLVRRFSDLRRAVGALEAELRPLAQSDNGETRRAAERCLGIISEMKEDTHGV